MSLLIAGLLLFIGIHLVPTLPATRAQLVSRLGEGAYKGLFSLAAAIGLGLVIYGFGVARASPAIGYAWNPPPYWARHVTFLLMLPVFPLLIASQLPGRLKTLVPHPMLLAVKLWALGHLVTKSTWPAVILFGALLAWAVYDLISAKRRERAGLLIIKAGPVRNDAIAIAAGLVLYVVFLYWGHQKLIGVPVLPANWPL